MAVLFRDQCRPGNDEQILCCLLYFKSFGRDFSDEAKESFFEQAFLLSPA